LLSVTNNIGRTSKRTEAHCTAPSSFSWRQRVQLFNQLAGLAIAWVISIVGTLILLFLIDKVIGPRVSPDQEAAGLELSQHNEEGYDLNS
jgi:ammonia channel protein AmtB